MPDSDLLEYVCNKNERDSAHLVGKASDPISIAVEVAPEILAKYAGVYAGTTPTARPIRLEIFAVGRELWASLNARRLLTPLSNRKFLNPASGAQLEFLEENGEAVALQYADVGGDVRLPRAREGK
jgi:hypothetical protein